jgi:hypothetical protein
MTPKVEYQLAGHAGRIWAILRPSLRMRFLHLSELCQAQGHGEQLSVEDVWKVQDFAVRIWWRVCMISILCPFP